MHPAAIAPALRYVRVSWLCGGKQNTDKRYKIDPDGVIERADDKYSSLGFLGDSSAEWRPSKIKRRFVWSGPLLHVVVLLLYFCNNGHELEAGGERRPSESKVSN